MAVLLHVGYGKAASTTLQDWFDRHPEMWWLSEKTILKGVAEDKKVCVLSDERLSLGLVFDPRSGLIACLTSIKQYQQRRCRELKALFPHAYVLIVTRGFSPFIHSFYSQYVSKGGILPFISFMEVYQESLTDLLDYNFLIRIYEEEFEDRVMVIPVELLSQDPDRFYGVIEGRLGLAREQRPKPRNLNSRIDPRKLQALPFISRAYLKLVSPFNASWQRAMHKFYVRQIARGWLGSFLSRLIPQGFLANSSPVELNLASFKGLATVLASRDIYTAFQQDYLLDITASFDAGTYRD